ncbi:hypothetical protein [Prosthecobacter sp.]|uniref:hypothetical protein n=1 Tax=Prosthecobacter sp. TaxID=1965333 RepID=UPI003784583E
MKTLLLPLVALCLVFTIHAEDKPRPAAKDEEGSSFRQPFTLKLKIDKERVYEEKFERHPYVHHNDVFLFSGDEFGVNLQREGDAVKSVTYQPDLKKADITFKFSQEVKDGAHSMMMLVIKNNTQARIYMDAMMTIPGKEGIYKTTILPLEPGLSGYESWPHPMVQLVLTKIRTTK